MPDGALDSQYGSDRNLQDRIDLHSRFSTSPVTLQRWIFEQSDPSHHDLALEVGCGNGRLYGENLSELPASGSFSLTDRSPGMVRAAKANLQNGAIRVSKEVGLFIAAKPRKELINPVPNGRQL